MKNRKSLPSSRTRWWVFSVLKLIPLVQILPEDVAVHFQESESQKCSEDKRQHFLKLIKDQGPVYQPKRSKTKKISESVVSMEKLSRLIETRAQVRHRRTSPSVQDSGIGTNQSRQDKRFSQFSLLEESVYESPNLCQSMIHLADSTPNRLGGSWLSCSSNTLLTQSYSDLLDIPTPYFRGRAGPKYDRPVRGKNGKSRTRQLIDRLFKRRPLPVSSTGNSAPDGIGLGIVGTTKYFSVAF
ncbi:hypothetical protein Ciccas_010840 [Cichlidogyrus casuarinus]|uniref:Uncharacterized protein n=1 Tax=Cichlidogyrus casuarinus TaxID=1844966 RepID=A0ABD2PT02_9PLAT